MQTDTSKPSPPAHTDADESVLAEIYAADEAALKRVTLRTQAFRWGLVGIALVLLAMPLVLASLFMNMDASGSGHVVGLAGMFFGFLGLGCFVGGVGALFDAWRAGR